MSGKKTRIIVVGAAWYGDWAKLFYQACERLGFPVSIVYNNFLPATLGGSSEKATSVFEKWKVVLKKASPALFAFLKRVRRRISERELLMRADFARLKGENVLVTFVWTPGSLWVVSRLKRREGVKTALWLGEPAERDPQWESTFDHFDAMFMIDEGNWLGAIKDERHRKRMGLIPLTSDEAVFHPIPHENVRSEYLSDVVFVGKYLPMRAEVLARIAYCDLKIYGYGWEVGFAEHPWLKEKYKGTLPLADSNEVYNGTKIAIGTLWFHKGKYVTATQRTFDIALAGTFQLSEDIPLTRKIFGDTIGFFNDGEELKKKVDLFLFNKVEREQLAQGSYEIALKYTYTEAAKKILNACNIRDPF